MVGHQKRCCDADHVWRDFGVHYGVLIKDMGLLARSVLVVEQKGKIVYKQIVPDMSQQPNHTAAVEAVQQAVGSKQ